MFVAIIRFNFVYVLLFFGLAMFSVYIFSEILEFTSNAQ